MQNIQLVSWGIARIKDLFDDVRSQQFNEIMPAIYSRFMEKEARQWRQIYKVRARMDPPSPLSSRIVAIGITTHGIPGQERKRARSR